MFKQAIIILLIAIAPKLSLAQQSSQFFEASDAVFKTFVKDGRVAYSALKASPEKLDKALGLAKDLKVPPSKLATYKAFWINAYNLAVLKGVIDNMPLNSPLDVKGFFDGKTYALGGFDLTLNDIENKKIRPIVNDARIHFVLVCGARGCPPIIAEAYKPAIIDAQLERQTKKALNDADFIRVSDSQVVVSEIFKWYNEDFVSTNSGVIDYINQFRNILIPEGAALKFGTYNWELNGL